jgi:hypothetical protein
VFAEEKLHLLALPAHPFDGYKESIVRVTSQLLISFDATVTALMPWLLGKQATVQTYAGRIIVVQSDTVVGDHLRHFGRDKVIYDPWHYLAVLAQKPGALRNGAPFRRWALPETMSDVRTMLEGRSGGDREFVGILSVVGRYGLDPVATACNQAISDKTVSRDVILSILSRMHDKPQPEPVELSSQLPILTLIPVVECSRYDRLLTGGVYGTA